VRTALLPTSGKKWDVKRNITTNVLVVMAAEGRMVRGVPARIVDRRGRTPGSRPSSWWPRASPNRATPRPAWSSRYLRRFGPATVADVGW